LDIKFIRNIKNNHNDHNRSSNDKKKNEKKKQEFNKRINNPNKFIGKENIIKIRENSID